MAMMRILEQLCDAPGCSRRATREVFLQDGSTFGRYCTQDATAALRDATGDERARVEGVKTLLGSGGAGKHHRETSQE